VGGVLRRVGLVSAVRNQLGGKGHLLWGRDAGWCASGWGSKRRKVEVDVRWAGEGFKNRKSSWFRVGKWGGGMWEAVGGGRGGGRGVGS